MFIVSPHRRRGNRDVPNFGSGFGIGTETDRKLSVGVLSVAGKALQRVAVSDKSREWFRR